MSTVNPSTPPASEVPSSQKQNRPQRYPALAALRNRDFRLLWLGQIVSVTGSQMQLVAINWHVWLLTKSALALGMVGLFRGGPIIICSLLGGVVADVIDRRRLMVATQTVMLLSASTLMVVTLAGLTHVWPIYLLTAVAACASAFDTPARQALMPKLVPEKDLANAVSIALIVFQISMICGPALAGLLLASHGPAIVYGANALSFVAVVLALIAMHTSGRPELGDVKPKVGWAAMREGLGFVRRTPVIVQTMTLDFAATFFASASALLPIFADKILNVGAHGYGLLAAAPATGAIVTGVIMARIGTFRRQGKLVIISVGIFGLATIGFGLSRVFWLSVLMLALTGASDTVSTVLRQTIRQLSTPDYLRGRMTSVNMVFFMGGPQLGEVEAGAVAALIGAPLSVVVGGIGSVAAAILAFARARGLRDYDRPR